MPTSTGRQPAATNQPPYKNIKLTRKQKAFVDELLANPKAPAAEAARKTYDVSTPKAAAALASENLAKPSIQLYMEEHVGMAKRAVLELVNGARSEDVRLRASQDILDREYGKARQQLEVKSQQVSIAINLSPTDNQITP